MKAHTYAFTGTEFFTRSAQRDALDLVSSFISSEM
jgi:hypothetical protein